MIVSTDQMSLKYFFLRSYYGYISLFSRIWFKSIFLFSWVLSCTNTFTGGDFPAFTDGGRPQMPLCELFQARTRTWVEPPTFLKLAEMFQSNGIWTHNSKGPGFEPTTARNQDMNPQQQGTWVWTHNSKGLGFEPATARDQYLNPQY